MRFRIIDMITRAEPSVQPAMALYVAMTATAALSVAVAAFASVSGGF